MLYREQRGTKKLSNRQELAAKVHGEEKLFQGKLKSAQIGTLQITVSIELQREGAALLPKVHRLAQRVERRPLSTDCRFCKGVCR